ncbi:SusF/SusE family outer membrane protein [Maribacter sp. ANRC-HE7]|uniref:SusF/SusE family outer membrane protein n=1 Tax=Maribacter aquimaris TaxID=2737171 RepID=A0ABR7UY32_9FLAO|nr:SusF/SusE family outer membrane protein [Maribacter aquimaris]MBD0777131.1 SusF/SusE family outer membrane protein [Maribacter aquimaris]
MKTIIKNFFKILPFILGAWLISSCDNDDVVPKFTLSQASENVAFSFSAADEYLISTGTMDNVAERFVWNNVDFGVQTEINYQLQGSIDNTFAAYDATTEYDSGTLSVTNAEVKVSDLNNLATLLGLEAGDSGQVYFRARAFAGSGEGADAVDSYSDVMTLNISILEETSGSSEIEISDWGIVGSAAPNAWDGPDVPFYTTNENNIIVAYASLIDGQIKFRQNNSWDDPNINYGDLTGDGILDTENDNNIDVTAGTYKITINLNDNSYSIEEFYWGLVGSATPNAWDGPDVKLSYDYTTNTFKTVVQLVDGEMKIRMNDSWDDPNINYGDLTGDGILDTENENNIAVTAGYYLVTVNFNTLEYSIEETEIWGVVGSAAPNGWDGPDVKFVPDFSNPGKWDLKDITLLDGDMKFRINDDWGGDYGDFNSDGILDQESDNNIIVTAGVYDISINFNDLTYTLTAK